MNVYNYIIIQNSNLGDLSIKEEKSQKCRFSYHFESVFFKLFRMGNS